MILRRPPSFTRLTWLILLFWLTLACTVFTSPRQARPAPSPTPGSVDPAATPRVAGSPTALVFPSPAASPTSPDPTARPARLVVPPYFTHLPIVQNLDRPFLARNIIIFIGDGMGPEQVKAAGFYLHGATGELSFEGFPHQAEMTTHSAGDNLTDSAAASTAMATGVKVNNGVIGLALPGEGHELYTLLEYARDHGLSTGLVTTSEITAATPAGFGAHTTSRRLPDEIAVDYLNQTRPNVLFGGGGEGMDPGMARAAGYTVVGTRDELLALDTEAQAYVSGQFGIGRLPYEKDGMRDLPYLWEMTDVALHILDNDPDGLFVVIEGGLIDLAGHRNDLEALVGEMAGFDQAVREAVDWASRHPDTLILVLADHETGGLRVLQNNGQGSLPDVEWTTTGHTPVPVPVYLRGPAPEPFPDLLDNTEIPALLSEGRFYQP